MIRKKKRIAILGAGIMGASLALFLSRHGFNVTIFDRENRPLDRASRWNEGKIHLGYLYGADPTLNTARHILTGGLHFAPILSELIGMDITKKATTEDDYYMVHKDSVVDVDTLETTYNAISALIRDTASASRYIVDVSAAQSARVSPSELAKLANTDNIIAGFRVPERSVNTQWVADRMCDALNNDPRIHIRTKTEVTYARAKESTNSEWLIGLGSEGEETVDIVINALWNGRVEIDRTAGMSQDNEWSNRYRLALFAKTSVPLRIKSAIVTVGAFGDVKNYDDYNFYLSWYPAGLMQQDQEAAPLDPRPFSIEKKAEVIKEMRAGLATVLPEVDTIFDHAVDMTVDGGFVFAYGHGSISDVSSTLHRRDRFGTKRIGNYFSIDTGKYSVAPWVAEKLARTIAGI